MAVTEQLEVGKSEGDPNGGNVVLINCTGLTGNGVLTVLFGKVEATDVQILPPGVQMPGGMCPLSVITPPKQPGGSLYVDVTVHDGDGRSDVKKKGFEYRTRGSKRKQRVDPAVAADPELIALIDEPLYPVQLQEYFDQEGDPMTISFEELLQGLGDEAFSLPNQPGSSAQHAAQPPPDPMEEIEPPVSDPMEQDEPLVFRSSASHWPADEAEDDDEEGEAPQYRSLRRAHIEAIRATHPLLSAPSKLPHEKKMDLPVGAALQAQAQPAEKEGEQEADADDSDDTEPGEPPMYTKLDKRDSRTGWNVFHLLAALGAARELATLLSLFPRDAPIDAVGPRGRTPFDVAMAFGRGGCARVLLRAAQLRALPWSEACKQVKSAAAKPANAATSNMAAAPNDARLKAAVEALRQKLTGKDARTA